MNSSPTVKCLAMLLTVSLWWGSSLSDLCNPKDKDSLLNFLDPIILPFFGWDNKTDCCSWPGIRCEAATGHVISLDLSYHESGLSIPPNSTLFQLSHLQYLDLSYNKFRNASIPKEIAKLGELTVLNISSSFLGGTIPTTVGNLRKLRELSLYANEISGTIPKTLGNLSSLTLLELYNNLLEGTIPDSLGNLRNLSTLRLNGNYLRGNIPNSFANLNRLVELDIRLTFLAGSYPDFFDKFPLLERLALSNVLAGSIPRSIGNLTSLKYLDIQDGLNGTLPDSLFNLPNLETLLLSFNNLEGPLPINVRVDSKLTTLTMNSNKITGKIPSWLFTRALSSIDLRDNNFTGPIDTFPTPKVSFLSFLNLRNNSIRGTIPSSLFQLSNIEILHLDGNDLSGAIEWSTMRSMVALTWLTASENRELSMKNTMNALFNLPSLEAIDLNGCGLTEFPSFFRGLENLGKLSLDNNRMRGSIKFEEGWNNLGVLLASFNMLEGSLPTTPPSVHSLYVSGNKFTGEIPAGYIRRLNALDLSRNNLSGAIPLVSGDLTRLSYLNCSNNKLSGEIPNYFGNMSLGQLDLSSNMLSGRIPKGLMRINSLYFLNLSFNQLEGPIPKGRLYPKESFLGNKGLCGPPLTKKC